MIYFVYEADTAAQYKREFRLLQALSEIAFLIGKPKYGSRQFPSGFDVHTAKLFPRMNFKTLNGLNAHFWLNADFQYLKLS